MEGISYLLIALAVLSIYTGISRWIFRVNDRIKNQEIIIDMLGQILLRQGYTVEEVKSLLEKHRK